MSGSISFLGWVPISEPLILLVSDGVLPVGWSPMTLRKLEIKVLCKQISLNISYILNDTDLYVTIYSYERNICCQTMYTVDVLFPLHRRRRKKLKRTIFTPSGLPKKVFKQNKPL